MKTLMKAANKTELQQRMEAISLASRRRWGKMSAAEMVCHLNDAFKIAMGDVEARTVSTWFTRNVMKHAGLWFPREWPHGVETVPECKAGMGGTPPTELKRDLSELKDLLNRFAALPRSFAFPEHSIFGEMTYREWMRWGYLHMDHHLRQFGA